MRKHDYARLLAYAHYCANAHYMMMLLATVWREVKLL